MKTQTRIPGTCNIATPERVIRIAAGSAVLMAVLIGTAHTPGLIFVLSILGPYLIQTGVHGKDPVYALADRLQVANRLQVWQHTLTTGMFVPILVAGDLISSFIVFCLSALGGFIATATIMGRDVVEGLTAWITRRHKEVPAGA